MATLMALVSAYRNKIEPFSFDIRKYEYPLEYLKFGATVALRKHIKLLPRVKNRYGGLWLSQVSTADVILINGLSVSLTNGSRLIFVSLL